MARWQWECITLIGKPPSHEGHPRKHIQHPPTSRVCVTFCVDLEERSYFYLDVTHLGLKTSSENILKSLTLTGSCNESVRNDFSCLAPVPPETQREAQHSKTEWLDVLVLWTVGKRKCCLTMRDTFTATRSLLSLFSVKALSILHDGTVINRFNRTYFVVCHIYFSGTQNHSG